MSALRIVERHDVMNRERAARMTGLSAVTISNYVLTGKLGAERIGRSLFVFRAEIEALARARAAGANPAIAAPGSDSHTSEVR